MFFIGIWAQIFVVVDCVVIEVKLRFSAPSVVDLFSSRCCWACVDGIVNHVVISVSLIVSTSRGIRDEAKFGIWTVINIVVVAPPSPLPCARVLLVTTRLHL